MPAKHEATQVKSRQELTGATLDDLDLDMPLLWVLRDELGITTPKYVRA